MNGGTSQSEASVKDREAQYAASAGLQPEQARVGVRRTYFAADQVSAMASKASTDLANGRLPWVSIKEPGSWARLASGADDDWLHSIDKALAAVPGPVWFTFHHEPNDDGSPADFRAAYARLLSIVTAPNVANVPIIFAPNPLTGENYDWADWFGAPGELAFDFLGYDAYPGRSKTVQPEWSLWVPQLVTISETYGVAFGICETGAKQTTYDAPGGAGWLTRAYDALIGSGQCVAVAYFDTDVNSVADWTLRGERMVDFAEQLVRPETAHL
ncbi:MAG: hypothetical protein ACR2J5_16415 [Geodermatophilaceae bacterium]